MPPSTGRGIARATALLMILEGVEQLTGLGKQMVIAAQFGTSERMDAYVVATTVAGLVILWTSLPINQVLIPMFRHALARQGEAAAWAGASVLFNNIAVVLALVGAGVFLVAPYLVTLFAPGFDAGTHGMTTTLSQIVVGSVVFMGAGRVLSQIYFSYGRFFTPGVAGTVNNTVLVGAFLLLAHTWGIYGLAVAVVLGAIAEFAVQLPILWQKRQLYSPRVDLRDPQMVEMAKLSVPLLLTAGSQEIARITDRIFASLLSAGSLSALGFAQRLTTLQNDFMLRPMMRSSYPHFARLSAEGDFPGLARHLFRYLRLVFFLTLPITIALMALSETVVRVLFQRGAFDETSVRLTSQALMIYTLGFPATALSRIVDRTFFTLKDTRTPTRLAILRIGLKIALSFVLIRPLAHLGIALAESVSQIIRLPLLLRALPPEIRRGQLGPAVGAFARTLGAGLVMAAVMYLVGPRLEGLVALPLEAAAITLLGGAAFAAVALVLARDEVRTVLQAGAALGRRSAGSTRQEDA